MENFQIDEVIKAYWKKFIGSKISLPLAGY